MGFQQVLEQYNKAIDNQMKRRLRQNRDFFTKHEQAALKFYSAAFNTIFMREPVREGTKIFAEDLHAENLDLRGSQLEKLPTNSGDPAGGTQA